MKAVRIFLLLTATVCVLGILFIPGSAMAIRNASRGRTFSDTDSIPHRRTGIVLGCSKEMASGGMNLFFQNRISAAAKLFAAGKVDYLLVSGDNHVAGYDESTDMKASLIRAGVPADRIYCDFAGFRTLDSMVRAKEVFAQAEVTVISQKFHNQRAIYIASHRGMDAIGFNAADVGPGSGFKTRCREQFARTKAVLDVHILDTQPKFLGPKIPIGEASANDNPSGSTAPNASR